MTDIPTGQHPRNSDDLLLLLRAGKVSPKHVHPVKVKVATHRRPEAEPRAPQHPLPPLRFGARHSLEDLATIVANIAQVCPKGFRQPSKKEKNWRSTSLVEKLMTAAGQTELPRPERSKRGQKRGDARTEYLDRVRETQDDGNIDPKYLSAHARALRALIEQLREAA